MAGHKEQASGDEYSAENVFSHSRFDDPTKENNNRISSLVSGPTYHEHRRRESVTYGRGATKFVEGKKAPTGSQAQEMKKGALRVQCCGERHYSIIGSSGGLRRIVCVCSQYFLVGAKMKYFGG